MKRPTLWITAVVVLVAGGIAWLLWGGTSSKPSEQQAVSGPYTVKFAADAPHIGANTFALEVSGAAPTGVTLEPVMAQMGHALTPVPAGPDGPGHFRAADVALPMSGQWEITVSLSGPAGPAQVVFPLLVK